ncbi:MAG: PilZ domain-containing protein [Planctomycetota bacterium]
MVSIEAPVVSHAAALVCCGGCDRRYYVLRREEGFHGLFDQREARKEFRPSRHVSMQRASAIEQFLATISVPGSAGVADGMRRARRVAVALPITLTPLDEQFLPAGETIGGATVDISHSGIAFVTATNPHAIYWLIDFSPAGQTAMQSIIKPIRGESIDPACWKTAGPLLTASDDPKAPSGRLIHTRRFS